MAIHRGIQSALFFYLSCAPCADYRYRKKRKQDAARNRAEREELEAEIPNLYRHPSPSSTNPYWKAEIELGPCPPPRGKKRSPALDDTRRLKSSGTGRSSRTSGSNDGPSFDMHRSISQDSRYDSKLRVLHDHVPAAGTSHSASSAARPFTAPDASDTLALPSRLRTKRSNVSETARVYRPPPINDLHPPVAPRIFSRDDVSWMLQPPPTADVMAGKRVTSRQRSDSESSRRSMTTASLTSRQTSLKVPRDAIREGDAESPLHPTSTNPSTPGQDHDRIPAPGPSISQHDFVDVDHTITDNNHSLQPAQNASQMTALPLSSTSSIRSKIVTAQSDGHPLPRPFADDPPSRSSPLMPRDTSPFADHSLAVIRALAPKSQLLVPTSESDSPVGQNQPVGDPRVAIAEKWESPDFEVGEWIHEQTKRDVAERWSMDI